MLFSNPPVILNHSHFARGGLILHIEALLGVIPKNRCNITRVNVLSYIMFRDSLCFRALRMCCGLTHWASGGLVSVQILYSCSYKHTALFILSCRVSARKQYLLHLPAPTRKSISPLASLTWMVTLHSVCHVCRNATKSRVLSFCTMTYYNTPMVQGQDTLHVSWTI